MVRKKRICHLIHEDGPGGGPGTVITHISFYVDYFDLQVIHGGRGRLDAACHRLKIPNHRLPLDRLSSLPWGLVRLVFKLRALKPDLLILHGQWGALVGALAGKIAGVPHMIYLAQWPAFYTDWDFGRVVRNYLCEAIPCRLADRTIAISEGNYYQYFIRQLTPPGRLQQIHNPFDLERLPDAAVVAETREKLGWNDGRCHVVSVSRLSDQKRLDWLLHSWVIVSAQNASGRLWIIGEGPDREALEALARQLGIENSCHFLGVQDGLLHIAAADFTAMTSLYEGHANVPLESMACGRPIVASDVDGVRDSFGDGTAGYLVPPGDIALFAERLLALMQDPALRERMGRRGRELVKRFSKPLILQGYLRLIQELLGETSVGEPAGTPHAAATPTPPL